MRPRWSSYLAIGLLAGAIMLFELALLRIFSFAIWHHFASMVLSIALLGFGIGGVALQLRPSLGHPAETRAARYAGAFGLTSLLAIAFVIRIPFDPTRIATDGAQIAYLLGFYVALAVPFALGGLAIVSLLGGFPERSDRLYASDLLGASLGCVSVGPLLGWLGAGGALLLAAAVGAVCAVLLHLGARQGTSRAKLCWALVALVLLAALPFGGRLVDVPPGESKALSTFTDRSQYPESRIVHTQWNELARVDVVENTGGVTWTANPIARIPSPAQTQIVLDGDAATPILNHPGDPADFPLLDYTLSSAAYQAFAPESALVIGAGGGVDVFTAVHHGVADVQAVELNPVVVELVTGRYAPTLGNLFSRPGVSLHTGEGRSFVRRQDREFDLIQLSLIDTWAASASGAYSLSEGYLYTVEAFEDYLSHLSEAGVFTITRWVWEPPRETLKLVTVAAQALRESGVEDPAQHVVVLGLGRMGSILVKRMPFTEADIVAIERVAQERHFSGIYAPHRPASGPIADFLLASDPAVFLANYEFDVTPATDDSPFFFNFGRWPTAGELISGWQESLLTLSGRLVLVAVLVQAALLSVVLLVLPLVAKRRGALGDEETGSGRAGPVVAYFSLIGLCFMLLEVVLMQRFTLFLGHPLYAVAFVLAVLLGSAGLGSMTSRRRLDSAARVFASIVALSVVYALALPAVFDWALGWPMAARLGLGALLLCPLGYALGFAFPAGLAQLVGAGSSKPIGWAWAANGCASVIGPVLASLLAIDFGFATVMLLAALGYAGAGFVFVRYRADSQDVRAVQGS